MMNAGDTFKQITLPDHPKLALKAVSAGFDSVEEYVRHLIEEDAGPLETPSSQEESLTYAEWKQRFEELLLVVQPGNPDVDDSRESIYPVR